MGRATRRGLFGRNRLDLSQRVTPRVVRWWWKFGDFQEFFAIAERQNIAPQILRRMVDFLSDPDKVVRLKLLLAAIVDVGEPFVKAKGGDGPLVFSCFERLKTIANACQVPHFQNFHAVAVAIATGDPTKKCCSAGTGSQKEYRAWKSVVFAKIQCRFVQHAERIQGC